MRAAYWGGVPCTTPAQICARLQIWIRRAASSAKTSRKPTRSASPCTTCRRRARSKGPRAARVAQPVPRPHLAYANPHPRQTCVGTYNGRGQILSNARRGHLSAKEAAPARAREQDRGHQRAGRFRPRRAALAMARRPEESYPQGRRRSAASLERPQRRLANKTAERRTSLSP